MAPPDDEAECGEWFDIEICGEHSDYEMTPGDVEDRADLFSWWMRLEDGALFGNVPDVFEV